MKLDNSLRLDRSIRPIVWLIVVLAIIGFVVRWIGSRMIGISILDYQSFAYDIANWIYEIGNWLLTLSGLMTATIICTLVAKATLKANRGF